MEKPSGFTKCRVDFVARQSRPTFPVFGGISGSIKTTLNTTMTNAPSPQSLPEGEQDAKRPVRAAANAPRVNYNLLATNFSSFTTSAANLRIPSPVFS